MTEGRRNLWGNIPDAVETIVPNTKRVAVMKHGKNLSLQFTQEWGENKRLNFDGFSMSDGTLRAIGPTWSSVDANATTPKREIEP